MKTGIKSWNLNILSENELERIYDASLSLLESPGLYSESDLFLDIFEKGGAKVDREARSISVSRDMVQAALQSAPKSFVLRGRDDPDMDMLLEPGRCYYGMGGTSEPQFWDYEHWGPRQPTKDDMVRSTRLGHALPNIDFVQTLCMSADCPTEVIFFHDFDAIFRNTTKPTVINMMLTQELGEPFRRDAFRQPHRLLAKYRKYSAKQYR